jgi:hypothetical protein
MATAHRIKPLAMFEPVPGGFNFRAPTLWIGSTHRYFVEEARYAELAAKLSSRTPLLVAAGAAVVMSLIVMSGVVVGERLLWTGSNHGGYPTVGRIALSLFEGVIVVLVPMQIFQWLFWRRIRPMLAGLTRVEDEL